MPSTVNDCAAAGCVAAKAEAAATHKCKNLTFIRYRFCSSSGRREELLKIWVDSKGVGAVSCLIRNSGLRTAVAWIRQRPRTDVVAGRL